MKCVDIYTELMYNYNCKEGSQFTITKRQRASETSRRKEKNMDDMKEFVAYSKKLLRVLKKIKSALQNKDYAEVEKLVDELIEDTEGDIQA